MTAMERFNHPGEDGHAVPGTIQLVERKGLLLWQKVTEGQAD